MSRASRLRNTCLQMPAVVCGSRRLMLRRHEFLDALEADRPISCGQPLFYSFSFTSTSLFGWMSENGCKIAPPLLIVSGVFNVDTNVGRFRAIMSSCCNSPSFFRLFGLFLSFPRIINRDLTRFSFALIITARGSISTGSPQASITIWSRLEISDII